MSTPPCGSGHCPVPPPDPRTIAAVPSHRWAAGTALSRGHTTDLSPAGLPPAGAGRPGRMSPLPGVSHAYVARMETAALLETALRDLTASAATVHRPMLERWAVSQVTTTADVDLADLRDPELASLEMRRDQLVSAGPRHYPCTARWAAALHDAGFHGALWHSRQADLHRTAADARGGLARTVLSHAAIEVAVIWTPPAAGGILASVPDSTDHLLGASGPSALVTELAALLGLVLETD
jgi:hypothetical protein